MASEERFGYEWEKYSAMDPRYEEQFRNWTGLPIETWKGKEVLDAGCGMGRNSYWALQYGALSVLAFDNDERSLLSARNTLTKFPNASIELHNLSEITWKNRFDMVMCIGVLHHVRYPRLALKNMVNALRKGGDLVIWIYSYEGNEWIVWFINPIRKYVTSRLPLSLVHLLSYGASIPLYLYIKIFKGPTPYFAQLATFKFKHVHSIVFDQLIPEVANYWSHDEVRKLVESFPLTQISVERPHNGMGWILKAIKK